MTSLQHTSPDPAGGPPGAGDDVLVFPQPVMGMVYEDFDRLLTEVLRSGAADGASAGSHRYRPDRCARGVRHFLAPEEGFGYADFFKVSDAMCVSVTDAQYTEDTWIGIAGTGVMKLRLVLSGRLLTESGALLSNASEGMFDISPGPSRTGFYIPANERTRIVCLHCRPQQLTQVMGLEPADLPAPLEKLFTHEAVVERLAIVPDAKVMQAGRQIAESRREMGPALRAAYLESLGVQMLVHALSGIARATVRRPPKCAPLRTRDLQKICNARDHLARHFAQPPRIRDLARLFGVNQTKLKSGFREVCGMSIYEYVLSCRMRRATELLATGEYDVAEVAFKVGYGYPTNFTHAFKKFHGTLPRVLAVRSGPKVTLEPQCQ